MCERAGEARLTERETDRTRARDERASQPKSEVHSVAAVASRKWRAVSEKEVGAKTPSRDPLN